jgi:hypothetical protein
LGAIAEYEGDPDKGRALRQRSADIARSIGERYLLGLALAGLAILARYRHEYQESTELFTESLIVSNELGDHAVLPRALAGLAGAARLAGHYARSARLFGAVEALRDADGTREHIYWKEVFEAEIDELHAALGEKAFEAAWAEGRQMTVDQAVAYAQSDRR